MPPPHKARKQESTLRKLARAGARPVDAQAEAVAGVKRQSTKAKVQERLKEVRAKLQKATDPLLRSELEAEVKRLYARARFGTTPNTDQRAIERATRALERAKWERENGQRRK